MISTRSKVLLVFCIGIGVAFLFSLGVWQVKRLMWKEALIARVQTALDQPPLPLAEIESRIAAGEDIEFRPAFAEGVFDHGREQHYFATHRGQSGYFVYTPLRLADSRVLFVNRGFVPMTLKKRDKRDEGLVEGLQRIEGLARSAPEEKPNTFVPDNDLPKNIFYWKSLNQMSERAFDDGKREVLPFFIDADATPVPGNWPRGGVTRITFPNSHLQYAMTWFGLALALLVVGVWFLFSQRRDA